MKNKKWLIVLIVIVIAVIIYFIAKKKDEKKKNVNAGYSYKPVMTKFVEMSKRMNVADVAPVSVNENVNGYNTYE